MMTLHNFINAIKSKYITFDENLIKAYKNTYNMNLTELKEKHANPYRRIQSREEFEEQCLMSAILGFEIANMMHVMHLHGVYHGDAHFNNIMIVYELNRLKNGSKGRKIVMFQPKLIDFGFTEFEKGSLIKYNPNKSLNLSRIDKIARQTPSASNAAYYNKRMSKSLPHYPQRYDSLHSRASTLNIPRRMLEKHKAIQEGIESIKTIRRRERLKFVPDPLRGEV